MATLESFNQHLIESLNENIHTIKYCLSFDKSSSLWNGSSKVGCLGIPAAILIFSLIDAIGSYYKDGTVEFSIDGKYEKITKPSQHFYVLNDQIYFKNQFEMNTINDLYSAYRSKLTHNNVLPLNNFLDIGTCDSVILEKTPDGHISKLNLRPLFEVVKTGIVIFIQNLQSGTISTNNSTILEIEKHSKAYIDLTLESTTGQTSTATGHTHM